MNLPKLAAASLLCLSMFAAVPAQAAEDPSRFLVSPALMQKLQAAEADMKLAQQIVVEEPPAEEGEPSIEAAIAKIDKDAKLQAVLAKHGLSSRELVLSGHALLHAGMFVATEDKMNKKKSRALYKGYTTEQRANIDLVRAFTAGKKK